MERKFAALLLLLLWADAAGAKSVTSIVDERLTKAFANANAAIDDANLKLDQIAAAYFNPAMAPAHGTRDPESINPRYGNHGQESNNSRYGDFGNVFSEPETGHPSEETVRNNLSTVVGNSLSQFAETAYADGDAQLAKRLRALSLKSIDMGSIHEDPKKSGMFKANAIFHDALRHTDVPAEITGDFSDAYWRLASIDLKVKDAPPPPKAPPPAQPIDTDAAVKSALEQHIASRSNSERLFQLYDPVMNKRWDLIGHPLRVEKIEDLGAGFYQATLQFVDKDQHHSLEVDFLVQDAGRLWRVEGTWIRSADDKPRIPPVKPHPVSPELIPNQETPPPPSQEPHLVPADTELKNSDGQ